MTSKISALTAVSSKHFFTDRGKTYRVDKLFTWINEKPEKHKSLPIHLLLKYIVHDTWNNFEELKKTNFQLVFDDSGHRQRMMQVDLQYPIIITNFNRLVDGVHRIFKAVFAFIFKMIGIYYAVFKGNLKKKFNFFLLFFVYFELR